MRTQKRTSLWRTRYPVTERSVYKPDQPVNKSAPKRRLMGWIIKVKIKWLTNMGGNFWDLKYKQKFIHFVNFSISYDRWKYDLKSHELKWHRYCDHKGFHIHVCIFSDWKNCRGEYLEEGSENFWCYPSAWIFVTLEYVRTKICRFRTYTSSSFSLNHVAGSPCYLKKFIQPWALHLCGLRTFRYLVRYPLVSQAALLL